MALASSIPNTPSPATDTTAMAASRPARPRHSARPFFATLLIFTLLAASARSDLDLDLVRNRTRNLDLDLDLDRRDVKAECSAVHSAADQCAFVKQNCHDDEAGLFEYLTLYYCDLASVKPVAFAILVAWLGLLFTTIGIAASDFFSINLSTISTVLGLSQSLAGVTFLALGNGSPDVFSTFAAMGSNSGSMAVGELIGAASFITSVIAGSMALVREFKVGKRTFVRDICFFIAAVAFAMSFLSDGNLQLWECCVMIAFYVFYVVVVVAWHAYGKRAKARRAREAASRGHFYGSGIAHGNDELEPYRDEPDEEDPTHGGPMSSSVDISVLERGPRIQIGDDDGDGDEDDNSDHNQHVAAEMASSMRLIRPRGRRNTSTITPIRPSLVGALEFRSVLSSLQQEGNVRMRPLHARTHSADGLGRRRLNSYDARASPGAQTVQGVQSQSTPGPSRNRASSSGAVPQSLDADLTRGNTPDSRARSASQNPHTVGGMLAPPPAAGQLAAPTADDGASVPSSPASTSRSSFSTSQPDENRGLSPQLSPFPSFTDSPLEMPPNGLQLPQLVLPSPGIPRRDSYLTFPELPSPKPVRWWPYRVLPPPHVVLGTLFPTIQGWGAKTIWDKMLSVVSMPSILLLTLTLPVVETDRAEDDAEGSVDGAASVHVNDATSPTSPGPRDVADADESEWQRYRRVTRSIHSGASTPPLIALDAPEENQGAASHQPHLVAPAVVMHTPKLDHGLEGTSASEVDSDPAWNRWLLFLQIFTGPLFCVLVVWANMAEDLAHPVKVLVRSSLASLVGSLVLLAVLLLTTSADRRPKYHFLFCFLGFCISIAWISTVAGEVVGVLKALGVILNISEAILGLTVFAVGNSIGDLVADVTVARLGFPVMALSACFGGPLLNILLGIGLGGAWQTIQAANKKHAKHPDRPFAYLPYHISVNGTLVVSAVTLLVTLVFLLVALPYNRWIMSRRIGWLLIGLWTVSTTANLAIEITGVWREVA